MAQLPSLEFYYVPNDPKSARIVAFLKQHPDIMELIQAVDLKTYYKRYRKFPDGIRVAPTLLEDHPARQKIRGIEGCDEILKYLASLSQFMNKSKAPVRNEAPPPATSRQSIPVNNNTQPVINQPKNVENAISAMGVSTNPQKMGKGAGLVDERIKEESWAKVPPPNGSAQPGEKKVPEGFTINVNEAKSTKVDSQNYLSQREQLNKEIGLRR